MATLKIDSEVATDKDKNEFLDILSNYSSFDEMISGELDDMEHHLSMTY